MTDKLREAAQMALDWRDKNGELLFALGGWDFIFEINEWSQSLRGALAQPEQEPMACIVKGCSNQRHKGKFVGDLCSPCATFITTGEGKYSQAYRNSQREWQGLTDEELLDIADMAYANDLELLQTLQAKLKEKNNG